jgi:prepilin peptidase CpaA
MSSDSVRAFEDVLLVAFVAGMIFTDMRWRRIPNVVTYPTMLIGLALSALEVPGDAARGVIDHLIAVVAVFAVGYPIVAGRMLKSGDVKFLMAVGALRGSSFVLYSALYGSLVGGLIALCYVAVRRLVPAGAAGRSSVAELMKSWIPYGVALGIGCLLTLWLELTGRVLGATS